MLKSYTYRIYPNQEQITHFIRSMGCVRYVYNKGLEAKIAHYEKTGKTLSYFDLATTLLLEEKKEHEWLQIPAAQSLQMSLRNLDNAFTNFFRNKKGFPKFKKKSGHQSIQYPQRVWVDFKRNRTSIPKIGTVFTVFDRKFEGKIKTCTVRKTPTNKFFISILVDNAEALPKKPDIDFNNAIGIDLGIKHFAIGSDGSKIDNPKFLNKLLDRLKVLQRRASNKVKGSNNQRKANLKVAKLYERIKNQRKDFLQKLSTDIIRNNQTIILEDLNIAGMVQNRKLSRQISDVSWGQFVRMLEYKAEWYGKNLITIGRFEPSSKTCSGCGHVNHDLKLSDREWECAECHTVLDRDINAAVNIKKFGLIKSKVGLERPAELAEASGCKQSRRSKKSRS